MNLAQDSHAASLHAGQECQEAALDYLSRGWSVLALCPPDHVGVGREHGKNCDHPGKRPWPNGGRWKEFQDRLPTEQEVRNWWQEHPMLNVGMAMGSVSGLVGIDIDGEAGEVKLRELSSGDLPVTLEFLTPGGGRRLLYRIPDGVRLKTTVHGAGDQELRFQAKGAQTVMPPSRHPSGGRYAWVRGRGPDDVSPALAPEWLVKVLSDEEQTRERAESLADGELISEGRRDSVLTSLAGTMRQRGLHEEAILAALEVVNEDRCDPPLERSQVEKIARSVARYKPDEMAGVTIKLPAAPSANGSTGNQEEPWQEPIPHPNIPAESFPLGVLPSVMARMAEAVAEAMPCPVDMPACTMLAAAGAAIGNTHRLQIKTSWWERARLWVALVSRPGSKKSPAASAVLGPVRARQRHLREQHARDLAGYELDLALWQETESGLRGDKPAKPVELQAYTVDATREALAELLGENKRGMHVHRDELTGWTRSSNQYKQGRGDDKQFWLSLWSGEDLVVNRRGRKVFIEDPFVCVSGNIPPGVLGELNDERGREDGFIHRVLFSWPEPIRSGWTDAEPKQALLQEYNQFFAQLYDLTWHKDGEPQTLHLDAKAKRRFVELIEELASDLTGEEFPEALRGPWSKLEGYCARLALTVHLCRQVTGETRALDVDDFSMQGAVALTRYFQQHARRVYPCLLNERVERLRQDIEAILGWIRRNRHKIEPAATGKPEGSFTWRMIRHDLHHRFEGREEDLKRALSDMEARGFLRETPRERAGSVGRKPLSDYFLNPIVWCQNDQNDRNGEND